MEWLVIVEMCFNGCKITPDFQARDNSTIILTVMCFYKLTVQQLLRSYNCTTYTKLTDISCMVLTDSKTSDICYNTNTTHHTHTSRWLKFNFHTSIQTAVTQNQTSLHSIHQWVVSRADSSESFQEPTPVSRFKSRLQWVLPRADSSESFQERLQWVFPRADSSEPFQEPTPASRFKSRLQWVISRSDYSESFQEPTLYC